MGNPLFLRKYYREAPDSGSKITAFVVSLTSNIAINTLLDPALVYRILTLNMVRFEKIQKLAYSGEQALHLIDNARKYLGASAAKRLM